jgi:dsRNA-specific ribonuclease
VSRIAARSSSNAKWSAEQKSRGQGVSRRIAEQVAAAAALIALGVENGND